MRNQGRCLSGWCFASIDKLKQRFSVYYWYSAGLLWLSSVTSCFMYLPTTLMCVLTYQGLALRVVLLPRASDLSSCASWLLCGCPIDDNPNAKNSSSLVPHVCRWKMLLYILIIIFVQTRKYSWLAQWVPFQTLMSISVIHLAIHQTSTVQSELDFVAGVRSCLFKKQCS